MSASSTRLFQIAKAAPHGGHRTSCGNFLRSDWDSVSLMQARAIRTLRWMKPGKREAIYFLIDDTRKEKRGQQMEAVSKIYDHKSRKFIRGHMIVSAAILFRGVILPWKFQLWIPKDQAGDGYLKTTQVAAQMSNDFKLGFDCKVRVLFDAFYLAPCVVAACKSRGFTWFSVAPKNRKVTRKHCQTRNIKAFAPGVLKHHGKFVRMRRQHFWRWMKIAAVDGTMKRLGRVRVVLSKRPGDPWNKTLAVVTNENKLAAREIISIYEKRWHIEVLFKELRSSLGLCDYQVLSGHAIERHLHLCGLAHQMLTHHSLDAEGVQAKQENKEVDLPPLRERLDNLRSTIRTQQARLMISKIKNRNARTTIRAFLRNELQIAA